MNRKPRILVVGIFVMDLIASTKKAPNSGETVIGLDFRTAPGGKGANQAVQCARLGADVTMVGRVGNDAYGRETVAAAAASGVDVSRVVVDPTHPTGVSAITLEITETGAHNRIVVCPGANHAITVEEISWIRDEVKNYDLVMLQFELPMFINEAVARWAHEAGVPVMVNPAPAAPVSPELFRCATFFSPNEHEAAAMAGHPIRVDENGANEDDLRAVAEIFREKGVENLIVTLGGNGSVAVNDKGVVRVESVKMPVVADTTAAGDSFVAAFSTLWCAGLPPRQALAFASHAAAITVSRHGAIPSLPTLSEVTALLRERGYEDMDYGLLEKLEGEKA